MLIGFHQIFNQLLNTEKSRGLSARGITFLSGVTEIRTRDTLLAYTRFPGVPLQPLEHHSLVCVCQTVFSRTVELLARQSGSFIRPFDGAKLMLLSEPTMRVCLFFANFVSI